MKDLESLTSSHTESIASLSTRMQAAENDIETLRNITTEHSQDISALSSRISSLPDNVTMTMDENGHLHVQDVAIAGSLKDLASASGLLGQARAMENPATTPTEEGEEPATTYINIDTDVFDLVYVDTSVATGTIGTLPAESGQWYISQYFKERAGTGARKQVAMSASGDASWVRTYAGNAWTAWVATPVRSEIEAINTLNAQQGQGIDAVEGRCTALEGRMSTAESDISAIEGVSVSQATQITALQEMDTTQNGRLDAIESTNSTQASQISALTTRVTTAEGDIDSLEELTSTHSSQISAIQQVNTTQTNNISALTTRVTTAEKDIDSLQSTVSGHTTSINSLDSRVDDLESGQGGDITGLHNQVNALEQSVTTLGNEIAALPDGTTITMSNGKLTCRNVAIGGSLSNLASARGQIGVAPDHAACDWNTLDENAVYWFSSANANNSTNRPSTNGGNLLVFSSASSGYVHQIYMQYNSHNCWHRYKNNNTWGSWQQMNMPTGLIGLYNAASAPSGFHLCNGSNNTPDLEGYTSGNLRFVQKA